MIASISNTSEDTAFIKYESEAYAEVETLSLERKSGAKQSELPLPHSQNLAKRVEQLETAFPRAESSSGKETPSTTRTVEELSEKKRQDNRTAKNRAAVKPCKRGMALLRELHRVTFMRL